MQIPLSKALKQVSQHVHVEVTEVLWKIKNLVHRLSAVLSRRAISHVSLCDATC